MCICILSDKSAINHRYFLETVLSGTVKRGLKPPPPPRKPSCKVDGGLPATSVLNYSQEELRAGGPLVLPRGLTVTDV